MSVSPALAPSAIVTFGVLITSLPGSSVLIPGEADMSPRISKSLLVIVTDPPLPDSLPPEADIDKFSSNRNRPSVCMVTLPPSPLIPAFASTLLPVPNNTSSVPVKITLPPLVLLLTLIIPSFLTFAACIVTSPPAAARILTLETALEKVSPAARTIFPFSALIMPSFLTSSIVFRGSIKSSTNTSLPF